MDPSAGLRSQLRNIESTYGHTIDELTATVAESGLTKHAQIVAMLKDRFGMSHGNAHRVALVARQALQAKDPPAAPRPVGDMGSVYDHLLAAVRRLGGVDEAPKAGYVSLRRRKQFAMLQPGARWVNVGLILPTGVQSSPRLEPASTWNALFTHRVRVRTIADIDDELLDWLRLAHSGSA